MDAASAPSPTIMEADRAVRRFPCSSSTTCGARSMRGQREASKGEWSGGDGVGR